PTGFGMSSVINTRTSCCALASCAMRRVGAKKPSATYLMVSRTLSCDEIPVQRVIAFSKKKTLELPRRVALSYAFRFSAEIAARQRAPDMTGGRRSRTVPEIVVQEQRIACARRQKLAVRAADSELFLDDRLRNHAAERSGEPVFVRARYD